MANINTFNMPVQTSVSGTEYFAVQGSATSNFTRISTAQMSQYAFNRQLPASIEFLIDNGGTNITAQTWGYLEIPFTATITGVRLLANTIGSVVVNVWMCTFAQFDAGVTHPVAADSITNLTPPTLSTAAKYSDTVLAGWITALPQGNILAFQVPTTATSISRVTLSLDISRTLI